MPPPPAFEPHQAISARGIAAQEVLEQHYISARRGVSDGALDVGVLQRIRFWSTCGESVSDSRHRSPHTAQSGASSAA